MKISPQAIAEVLLIEPVRHGDERGWFSETYHQDALEKAGFQGGIFVQDNHVRSTKRGILRGLHFQRPPNAQDKLIRCIRGSIFDVAVDIRRGSTTFGRWVGAELSEDNGRQLLVPKGFAHAYCTLSEHCEVLYKVTSYYAPQSEGSIHWDDPDLAIEWQMPREEISVNERDARAPRLSAVDTPF